MLRYVTSLLLLAAVANASNHGPATPTPGPPEAGLIGLLELPTVLNLDAPGASSPPPRLPYPPVVVRSAPAADADQVSQIAFLVDVVTHEYAPGRRAAAVLERRGDWYRLALSEQRSGWVSPPSAGPFHTLAELLTQHQAHLTENWDGRLWHEPGNGKPNTPSLAPVEGNASRPVRVVATRDVGATLWLQIDILAGDPCAGAAAQVQSRGWIPAFVDPGKLAAWFDVRGC